MLALGSNTFTTTGSATIANVTTANGAIIAGTANVIVAGGLETAWGETARVVVGRDIRHHTDFLDQLQRDFWLALLAAALLTVVVGILMLGYVLFGGGLLGFEIGAGLAARLDAGVVMEVTAVRVEDGKLVAERPILGDTAISQVHYRSAVGIIIGRLNAFEIKKTGGTATVEDVSVEFSPFSTQATVVTRGEPRGADLDIADAAAQFLAPEFDALAEELFTAALGRGLLHLPKFALPEAAESRGDHGRSRIRPPAATR